MPRPVVNLYSRRRFGWPLIGLIAASVLGFISTGAQAASQLGEAALVSPVGATKQLSLVALLELARQQDPIYLAALARHQAQQQAEQQSRAALLPQLGATALFERQSNTSSAMGLSIDSDRRPTTYAVVLQQAIFQPAAWQTYKQGQLLAESARLSLKQAEQDLILRVVRVSFQVMSAQIQLHSIQAQKAATEEQFAFARRNFELGEATITDQQEAQARLDLIAAQALSAQTQLDRAQLALQSLIGGQSGQPLPMQVGFQMQAPQPADPQAWAQKAQAGNLQVLQAQLGALIAQREADKAKAGHLPTVSLRAQWVDPDQQVFDSSSLRPFDINVRSDSLGIQLELPLFSGGLTSSQITEKGLLLDQSRQDEIRSNRLAAELAQGAYLEVLSGLAQVKALETAVQSSELALRANETGYRVGVRVNIDVLNAQQQVAQARRDLQLAQLQTLLASLELQAAVGQLTTDKLETLGSLFSPSPLPQAR